MRKIVIDGFIIAVLKSNRRGIPITEQEYHDIMLAIANKPSDPEGYHFMLADPSLLWTLVPDHEPDPEPVDN